MLVRARTALVVCAVCLFSIICDAEPRVLKSLPLENLDEDAVSLVFPREEVTVLLFADRGGKPQVKSWEDKLKDAYDGTITIQPIALVDEIPILMRGFARRSIRKDAPPNILLDWEGVARPYFDEIDGEALVVVADEDGTILHEERGLFSEEGWKRLDKVLAEKTISRG